MKGLSEYPNIKRTILKLGEFLQQSFNDAVVCIDKIEIHNAMQSLGMETYPPGDKLGHQRYIVQYSKELNEQYKRFEYIVENLEIVLVKTRALMKDMKYWAEQNAEEAQRIIDEEQSE